MRPVARLLRGLDAATAGANIVGTLLIVGLVLIICVDVIGRETIGTPLPGVPEMVSLSIVAIVFLQVPQALKAGRLTRSDGLLMLLERRSARSAAVLETIYELAGVFVMAAILYAHWPILLRAIARQEFIGSIGNITFPVWPVKVAILIGASLLLAQFLARILRRFVKGLA